MEELLRSPLLVRGVLTAPQLADAPRGRALLDQLSTTSIEHETLKETEFRSAAETESPQGVLAIGEIPARSLATLSGVSPFRLLVLDALQDPGNVGTVVRTAAALGVDATVALPGTVDLWNPKVVRAAMGAHFHSMAFHTTADVLFSFLETESIPLWAAEAEGQSVESMQPPSRLALVVGNEGSGLSSSVRERTQTAISIPIAPAPTS